MRHEPKVWKGLPILLETYIGLSERTLQSDTGRATHLLALRCIHRKRLVHRNELGLWPQSLPKAVEEVDRLVTNILEDFGAITHSPKAERK